jgi:hypothetical protein
MADKVSYKTAWILLLIIALSVFAIVAVPVWVIQPFAAQTDAKLQLSLFLKSWSPTFTILAMLIVVALSVYIWINSKRWFGKAFLIAPLAVVLICTWFARQNHFEWMFNPLAETAFAKASETDFVADDDMVLAVKINGEAVAYPVRQMAYHHVVADVVGGKQITATY